MTAFNIILIAPQPFQADLDKLACVLLDVIAAGKVEGSYRTPCLSLVELEAGTCHLQQASIVAEDGSPVGRCNIAAEGAVRNCCNGDRVQINGSPAGAIVAGEDGVL